MRRLTLSIAKLANESLKFRFGMVSMKHEYETISKHYMNVYKKLFD